MGEPDTVPMEIADADAAPALSVVHSLSLLQLIKSEQSQNGIKHGDYERYRRHCGNKLKALFKLLKFQHGRTKYVKRKIDATTVTDARFLHILVFYAERAWASAIDMKKENERSMSLPRRNHLIRRLRKATFWAQELTRIALEVCDTRTFLEAEAYRSWMHGNLLLERESDWSLALAMFLRAKMLFEELGKVLHMDQQALCMQMVEDSEPSIRYCTYQLERKGAAVPSRDVLLAASDPCGQPGLDMLRSQLASLAEEAQGQQPAAAATVLEWQGRRYTVRGERVKACLHQANEFAARLAEDASSGATTSAQKPAQALLAHFTRMINCFNEAKSHVRNALRSNAAAEGDAQYEELVALELALQGTVLQKSVERAQVLVRDAEERFAAGMERTSLGKRAREKDKYARAEDVVQLMDGLCRSLGELGELGARLGGRAGEELHDSCSATTTVVQAHRCYYVAQALLSSDKHLEAYALFGRAAQRVEEAKQRLAERPGGPAAAAAELADLQRVSELISAYRAVAHAEHCAEGLKGQEAVQQGLGGISLAEQQQQQAGQQGQGYLLERLGEWESFAGVPGAKAPRIFKAPFAMQPIPMRPIMLDTASNFVEYPSLEHRVRKAEKKSMLTTGLSSLFGWGAKK